MKVLVTQIETATEEKIESYWNSLQRYLSDNPVDLLLFPEIGFFPWVFCGEPENVESVWKRSVQAHEMWIDRFHELRVPVVAGSRPVFEQTKRYNSGFIWTEKNGLVDVHRKYYLPDEPGFWEASWYDRGSGDFRIHQVEIDNQTVRMGFMICTDLWFYKQAWEYGKQGAHIILCPRSTELANTSKWRKGGQVSSIVSGTFNLSSNHSGLTPDEKFSLGGTSWITDPDGNTIGETNNLNPFLVAEIDIEDAEKAKSTYPRYVKD